MDLREQKYVCTLAELGNLTRAAERLYISQPGRQKLMKNVTVHSYNFIMPEVSIPVPPLSAGDR